MGGIRIGSVGGIDDRDKRRWEGEKIGGEEDGRDRG